MKIAIVGSRDFKPLSKVTEFVNSLPEGSIIVSGGARGVDTEAERSAIARGLDTIIHLPDWNKYGKQAGFVRNRSIIKDCDRLVAFWDGESNGTRNAIQEAINAKKSVKVIYVESLA